MYGAFIVIQNQFKNMLDIICICVLYYSYTQHRHTAMALFQTKTGSEWHSTETRGAMVTVNGQPIYKALKAKSQSWSEVGSKGRHGKWCIAEYDIPVGSNVTFVATANGKERIEKSFIVSDESIDFDGYDYANDTCGWIVSI
jgi:hypothetical protein